MTSKLICLTGLLQIFLINGTYCQSQPVFLGTTKIYVEKLKCEFRKCYGSKLILHIQDGENEKVSSKINYSLMQFTTLPDTIKLQIAELLLKFKADTDRVCTPVSSYGYEGYENTCKKFPVSRCYSIQIEALYLINRLCFPHAASFYYCFPVLVDVYSGNEINEKHDAVETLFLNYENWHKTAKKKGGIANSFPFNTGQFSWFGGKKSEATN